MSRTRFALLAALAAGIGAGLALPPAQAHAMRVAETRTADGDGGSVTHGAPPAQDACAAGHTLLLADGDGGSPTHSAPQPQFA